MTDWLEEEFNHVPDDGLVELQLYVGFGLDDTTYERVPLWDALCRAREGEVAAVLYDRDVAPNLEPDERVGAVGISPDKPGDQAELYLRGSPSFFRLCGDRWLRVVDRHSRTCAEWSEWHKERF